MKRVERPPLTVYLERQFLSSALFLGVCLAFLTFGYVLLRETPPAKVGSLLWIFGVAALSGLTGVTRLFWLRALVIDPVLSEVTLIERQLFRKITRKGLPLRRVSVRCVALPQTGSNIVIGTVWIDSSGLDPLHFTTDHKWPDLRLLAQRLAADLGCSLTVANRA